MLPRLQLAIRNVARQRQRTVASLLAISLGVASIVLAGGFVRDIFDQLAEATIRSETGHIQIAKKGFFSYGSRSPEQFFIENPTAVADVVRAQPGVTGVMGRLKFSGLLSNGRSDLAVIVEGIEPDQEARLGTFVKVKQGRRLEDKDRFGAMVGEGVAQSLRLAATAPVSLLVSTTGGAMNALDLEVISVVQSFSRDYDARAVKISLSAAQDLLATQGVNTLVVSVTRTADAASIAESLRAPLGVKGLEVKLWSEINDFYEKAVDLYGRQFGVLQLIILLMVLLSVVNTMTGAIFERTGEFGTMRAVGNQNREVIALVLTEGALLGFAGAILGALVGALLAAGISYIGIPMPPPPNSNLAYSARIAIDAELVYRACLIGFAASVLGSLPAAIRAARISIVEALQQTAD